MYSVYVLQSTVRNYLYVGLTNNLLRRFAQHNSGYERTTRAYKPFVVVFVEVFHDRISAREREKYLKTSTGKRWIRAHCV